MVAMLNNLPMHAAVAAALLLSTSNAFPVEWRFNIARTTDSSWPAAVGYVEVCIPEAAGRDPVIRVFNPDGAELGRSVLWSAPGEPTKLLFDSSGGHTNLLLVAGENNTPSLSWTPTAGLVLETRRRPEGPADSLRDVLALWHEAGTPLGRSLVSRIYSGVHHHGEPRDFIAHYSGFFNAPVEGEYLVATVSRDASFLLINGELAAEWPGWHEEWEGIRGEKCGTVSLAAGLHRMEYFHVHRQGRVVAVVAWRPPDGKFDVMPTGVFATPARFTVDSIAASPTGSSPFFLQWRNLGHAIIEGNALVETEFRAVLPPGETASCHWVFDDGSTGEGVRVVHVFPAPGMRSVKLIVHSNAAVSCEVTQSVKVHPVWSAVDEWQGAAFDKRRDRLMNLDLDIVPFADLVNMTTIAWDLDDKAWLSRLGRALWKRRGELTGANMPLLFKLGFHFKHYSEREYDLAEAVFRWVSESEAADSALREKARLRLAELLVHCMDRSEDARALLQVIGMNELDADEQRLKLLLQGDALLAMGLPERARIVFLTAGNTEGQQPRIEAVRRRAAIERARHSLSEGRPDEAAELISAVEWGTPLSRMSAETGLPMVDVHIVRLEYPFALARCRRLGSSLGTDEPDRAKLLLKLAEIYGALGDQAKADDALKTLLEKHPYSEAAAVARERQGR